mgnify:CR=1 FL=1
MKTLCEVELKGLPPTVNHLYRNSKRGYRYKTVSGRYYQDYVSLRLSQEWQGRSEYAGDIGLHIEFTVKTRRRWDIDNRVKALQDCLSMAGIIKDDKQVNILHVERHAGNKTATYVDVYRSEEL